jgi:hypothetical protein
MSTILFINGYRMLQQAVAVSLFPDHDVRVGDTIPNPGAIAEVDAVIIDAASPRGEGDVIAQAVAEAEKRKLPVIWIEGPDALEAPNREALLVVKTPIQRSALHAAVTEALTKNKRGAGSGKPGAAHGDISSKKDHVEAADAPPEAPARKKVIELLDVVDAPDVQMEGKTPPQNKP